MADAELARAVLAPRNVALIGASGDPSKNTARPLKYLRKHGFKGGVFPINARRDEVMGERAWPDLKSLPEPIDHVYAMVPKAAVPGVIEACAAVGVKVVSVYADGFAEAGDEGMRFQQEMIAKARRGGVRVIGPNSMGLINVHEGLGMTTNAALEAPVLTPGPLALISQSGTALGGVLSRGQARGLGFSKLLSVGNESDLSVGEIVDFLVDDPQTGAILLFLETIRRADDLAAAARRAFAAGKPVLAYKLGRSDAGRQMAVSHSGALAGPDAAATAFFAANGIIRVDTLEGLVETPNLLAGRRPGTSRRVAVMTTTGGGAAMVVDRLGLAGIEFSPPPETVVKRLGALDIRVGGAPVIDVTMVGARPDVYGPTLGDLIDDPGSDAVVCVVGSSAQFRPEVAVAPIIERKQSRKPVAVFCVPEAGQSLATLAAAGLAGFRTPESCADGVRAFLEWRAPSEQAVGAVSKELSDILASTPGGILDEAMSRKVFEALGVEQAAAAVIAGPDDEIPDGLIYPLAAKVMSADLPHKTEAGAVALNIADAVGLRDVMKRIWQAAGDYAPTARLTGILLQPMTQGLAEVLLGYRVDPEVGPLVVLGVGGIMAEVYGDVAVRIAPVDEVTARAMIDEVKGLAPIRGYRGLPRGDIDALAAAVVVVSRLALAGGDVEEAEINPLIVREAGKGVVAVDALVRLDEKLSERESDAF